MTVFFIFVLSAEYSIFNQIPIVSCKTCWKERTRMAALSAGRGGLCISSKRKEGIHITKTRKGEVSWGRIATECSPGEPQLIQKNPESGLFLLFYFHMNTRGKDASWNTADSSSPFVGNLSHRRYLSALEFIHN